jgi:hypothetical protein
MLRESQYASKKPGFCSVKLRRPGHLRRVAHLGASWVVGVIAAWFVSLSARADDSGRFRLDWFAPATCPERATVQAAIEKALQPGAVSAGAPMVVRVRVSQVQANSWTGEIWMYNDVSSGERTIEGRTCTQVVDAVTLIVSLALDAQRQAAPEPPRAARVPAARARPDEPLHLFAALRALGDKGSLPQPDVGLGLVLAAQYRLLSVELQGSAWLPRRVQGGPVADSGGEFQLYTGAARGCIDALSWPTNGVALGPCAGAELGGMRGSSYGLSHPAPRTALWAAGLAGLSLRYVSSASLFAALLAEASVPWRRPGWQIMDFGLVFRPNRAAWRLSLSLGWRFR